MSYEKVKLQLFYVPGAGLSENEVCTRQLHLCMNRVVFTIQVILGRCFDSSAFETSEVVIITHQNTLDRLPKSVLQSFAVPEKGATLSIAVSPDIMRAQLIDGIKSLVYIRLWNNG